MSSGLQQMVGKSGPPLREASGWPEMVASAAVVTIGKMPAALHWWGGRVPSSEKRVQICTHDRCYSPYR